ncbi:transcriptional regulator ATRX [Helicoverpa armigera]|uniref:transcriptional regulator ATRX n=1 Tax=Helicoverpa armigera TaxID=29058 RepID=UPI003082D9A7
MSETANSEGALESEKPVHNDDVQFPPFPDPKDDDFDDDIAEDERNYYRTIFKDINQIKGMRLHCTACDRHLGCAPRNEVRMRAHPMLRTLVCHNCHVFYNSGEFEKGDDGSELYCRWCGQGGQVYCCSDCPHVFCAKCIRRNLGTPKIKEIENTDDWKCFKCNNNCLWDLRALCWAVLRFCDLKNKIVHQTQDTQLKEAYKKDCAIDYSECCKAKSNKRVQKMESIKKKEIKKEIKKEVEPKPPLNIISKIPSTIQVKKFAAVNIEESKSEKKPQKRSMSPKIKPVTAKTSINTAQTTRLLNPLTVPPLAKKMRLPNSPMMSNPVRVTDRNNITTYSRIRPKPPHPIAIANCSFNGFGASLFSTDNINLSIESLTQGLDMSAVAALTQNSQDDDVVCTPDFPLEPLCEVTEDNDDDVQCITPGPVVPPKFVNPPPLVPRSLNNLSTEITADNIIQMTDNDVTVNAATGGLKFRVDPQTLSSNKMYRLPDGRIFAINANPSMPGGYSATIVAVTEPTTGKAVPKGATFAAKLSSVSTSTPTPTPKPTRNIPRILKRSTPKSATARKSSESSSRECDLNVPVEWYRYNLIDAVDALEYALSRLHKLKKDTTTVYLRTRSVNEMRNLHRTLDRLLGTSSSRFGEIRENLNKGLKQYVLRKSGSNANNSEDDDDVEILPDLDNDDPIFIDENSVESAMNGSENQEVDLTGAGSSEYNDSGENSKVNNFSNIVIDSSEIDNENREHGDVLAVLSHNVHATEDVLTRQDCDNVKDSDLEKVKELKSEGKVNENKDTDLINSENHDSENESETNARESKLDNNIKIHRADKVSHEESNEIKGKENTDINIGTETVSKESIIANNGMDDGAITLTCNEVAIEDDKEGNGNNDKEALLKEDEKVESENIEDDMNHKDLNEKADSQDSNDKVQDIEMSEEMIETLLKDDNLVDETTSSLKSKDVAEVLKET